MAKATLVFTERPLGSIRRGDVQAFISGLELAPSTVRVVRQHLVSLFGAAVDDQLIAANPAKGVKLPQRTKGEIVPPTSDEITALVDAAASWFRIAIVMGAGLGLRQSEVSGLTGRSHRLAGAHCAHRPAMDVSPGPVRVHATQDRRQPSGDPGVAVGA
jgi:integrase